MKPIRRNTISHDTRSRDAALRRLRRTNRWLIAGSAVLTGLFVDLAASAFSGHASSASAKSTRRANSHHSSTKQLKPPTQAPKAAAPQPAPQTTEAAPEAEAPAEERASEPSAPAREAAPEPAPEAAPEAHEPETQESAPPPSEPSEPVVSGGS